MRMAVPTTYNTCLTSGTPSGATTRLTMVAYGAEMPELLLIDIDSSPTDELRADRTTICSDGRRGLSPIPGLRRSHQSTTAYQVR